MANELAARFDGIERMQIAIQNQVVNLQLELAKSRQEMLDQLSTSRMESQQQFFTMMDFLSQMKKDLVEGQKSVTPPKELISPVDPSPLVIQMGQSLNPGLSIGSPTVIRQSVPHLPEELIEDAIKSGKLKEAEHSSKTPNLEMPIIHSWGPGEDPSAYQPQYYSAPPPQSRCTMIGNSSSSRTRKGFQQNQPSYERPQFSPIPMTYEELYSKLLRDNLITPIPVPSMKMKDGKLPRWYDVYASCEYHSGAVGHSIEKCFSLKKAVQELVEAGILKF